MNKAKLKRLLHSSISVSLTLLGVGALFFFVVWPALSSRAALQERLQALQLQEQKFGLATLRTPALEKELEELAAREINLEGFLEEKPLALAAADLQQMIGSFVEEAGASLISAQVLQEADNDSPFPAIIVKVNLHGNTDSLHKILYRIDTSRLQLLADNLRVQKRQSGGNPSVDELGIRFDVTAFIYRPESS